MEIYETNVNYATSGKQKLHYNKCYVSDLFKLLESTKSHIRTCATPASLDFYCSGSTCHVTSWQVTLEQNFHTGF
jgi:hypothetical protein